MNSMKVKKKKKREADFEKNAFALSTPLPIYRDTCTQNKKKIRLEY